MFTTMNIHQFIESDLESIENDARLLVGCGEEMRRKMLNILGKCTNDLMTLVEEAESWGN